MNVPTMNISANIGNSLAESEAKPECFNFTFNPKDEELHQAAANNPALSDLKVAKH